MEAEKYRNASAKEIKPLAKFILQNFIQVNTQYNKYYIYDPHCLFQAGSVQEINIDSTIHHQAVDGLAENPPNGECLIHAQEHIFKLMKADKYPRFIKTLPK